MAPTRFQIVAYSNGKPVAVAERDIPSGGDALGRAEALENAMRDARVEVIKRASALGEYDALKFHTDESSEFLPEDRKP